jgi:endonuclease/exonuclease/phosphatase family metal-dependent hydrolase
MVLCKPELRPNVRVVKIDKMKRWIVLQVLDIFVAVGYFATGAENSAVADMFSYVHENEQIDLDRLVVVGDFNARMKGAGDHSDNARGSWFKCAVLEEFQFEVVRPVSGRWTSVTPMGKGVTDLVLRFGSQQCDVRDLRVHEDCDMNGSDHRPLSFCVDFSREYELPKFSRWNIGCLKNA